MTVGTGHAWEVASTMVACRVHFAEVDVDCPQNSSPQISEKNSADVFETTHSRIVVDVAFPKCLHIKKQLPHKSAVMI